MRIKNYADFQVFKDRAPPWICLHRTLLEDPEWFALDKEASWVLVCLWLIASEDKSLEGKLPHIDKLAFRLRMSASTLEEVLGRLNHWILWDGTNPYKSVQKCTHSIGEQSKGRVIAEQSLVRSKARTNDYSDSFEAFWKLYPRRVGKRQAFLSWQKATKRATAAEISAGAERVAQEVAAGREVQFVKHPQTWLNADGWLDEPWSPKQKMSDMERAMLQNLERNSQ